MRRCALPLATCLAALSLAPGSTHAQTANDEATVSVSFEGGDFAEYLDQLRSSTSDPINVVLQGRAASLDVGQVRLLDVSVSQAIEAIAPPGSRDITITTDDGESITASLDVRTVGDVYVVAVEAYQHQTRRHDSANAKRFYDLSSIVGPDATPYTRLTLADVNTAIETGVNLGEPTPRNATLQFHAETGLLMARAGDQDQIAIDDIVSRLNNIAHQRMEEARIARLLRIDESRQELREARARIQQTVEPLWNEHQALTVELADQRVNLVHAGSDEEEQIQRQLVAQLDNQVRDTRQRLDAESEPLRAIERRIAALDSAELILTSGDYHPLAALKATENVVKLDQ